MPTKATKAQRRIAIAIELRSNAFAIERTGFQNEWERRLAALLREAADALEKRR